MSEATMVYVAGTAFKCECGCNVFTRDLPRRINGEWSSIYCCNACRAEYEGVTRGQP